VLFEYFGFDHFATGKTKTKQKLKTVKRYRNKTLNGKAKKTHVSILHHTVCVAYHIHKNIYLASMMEDKSN